jgi:hypothetical protein
VVVYRDRTYAGLPIPHSNDGTTRRPLLAPYRTHLTAHYPGSPLGRSYAEMAGDVKKKTYVHSVQRSALANGKSFEYNYFVFMDGEVWEYAGDFLAAHSAGENADAYGVQFVNGQDDLCTDAQVTAYQWLRDIHLKSRQRVTMTAATIPHREMPGAATACPGPRAVIPRLADLRQPYAPQSVPKGVPVQFVIKGAAGTAVYVTDWLTKRHIDGPTYDLFRGLSTDPANGIRMNNGAFFEIPDAIVDAIPVVSGGGPAGPPADVIADEVAAELARRLVA